MANMFDNIYINCGVWRMIITGGEGLIGKELRKELDFKLILDINIKEEPDKNIYKSNAGNIEDFCNMIGIKPKIIYHLVYQDFNVNNFGKNVNEFIKVLEYAKKVKAKVIYLSSSSVYFNFRNENLDENPIDLKGEYYFTLDRIAKYYRNEIEIVGFRIFKYDIKKIVKAFKLARVTGNGTYNLSNVTCDMNLYKKDFGVYL